jgi:hypothetical protein
VVDLPYREVWLVDFEFASPPWERPDPACLVALELRSGRKIRLWRSQFGPREMRNKFMAGNFNSWTQEEREAGLDYCETDVVALANLLPAMLPTLGLHHALIRGRYSGGAVSFMQHEGIPLDATLGRNYRRINCAN